MRALVRIAWEAIVVVSEVCVDWLRADKVLLEKNNNYMADDFPCPLVHTSEQLEPIVGYWRAWRAAPVDVKSTEVVVESFRGFGLFM